MKHLGLIVRRETFQILEARSDFDLCDFSNSVMEIAPNCVFTDCNFENTVLRGFIVDCRFENCNFEKSLFEGAYMKGLSFEGGHFKKALLRSCEVVEQCAATWEDAFNRAESKDTYFQDSITVGEIEVIHDNLMLYNDELRTRHSAKTWMKETDFETQLEKDLYNGFTEEASLEEYRT